MLDDSFTSKSLPIHKDSKSSNIQHGIGQSKTPKKPALGLESSEVNKIGNAAKKSIPKQPPILPIHIQEEILASRVTTKEKARLKNQAQPPPNESSPTRQLQKAKENLIHQSIIGTELKTKKESHKSLQIVNSELSKLDNANLDNEIILAEMEVLIATIELQKLIVEQAPEDETELQKLKNYQNQAELLRPSYISAKIQILKENAQRLNSILTSMPQVDQEAFDHVQKMSKKLEQMEVNCKIGLAARSDLPHPLDIVNLVSSNTAHTAVSIDSPDASQVIENIAKEINLRTPQNSVTKRMHQEVTEPDLVKRILQNYKHEKDLILSPNAGIAELRKAQKYTKANFQLAVEKGSRNHTYETSTGVPDRKNSNLMQFKISQVEKNIIAVNQLKDNNPIFFKNNPLFAQQVEKLTAAFNAKISFLHQKPQLSLKGQDKFLEDLQYVSDAVKVIETAFIQRLEIDALLQPDKVFAREAVKASELKSAELVKIIDILNIAYAKSSKIVLKTLKENDSLEIKPSRKRSLSSKVLSKAKLTHSEFKPKFKQSESVYEYILDKIQDVHDPNLRSQVSEINTLLSNDPSFLSIRQKNSKIDHQFKLISSQLETKVESRNAPINILNELLKPPGNPEFQKAFLNSYRFIISEFTGNSIEGISDSQKLLSFLEEQYIAPDATLYEKQRILNMAIQFVIDPFINNYELFKTKDELSVLGEQIRQLAELAALDGSPTLNALSTTLSESLIIAETTSPQSEKIIFGNKSVSKLIDDVAQGKLSPSVNNDDYITAVREFASSVTSQNVTLFKSINSADFKNGKWNQLNENAPIRQFIIQFNSLSNFAVESILGDTLQNERVLTNEEMEKRQQRAARMMEFFINVQNEFLTSRNGVVDLNGFFSLQAAMNRGEILRLKDVFSQLPPNVNDANQKFIKLADHEKNYKNIRRKMDELESNNKPFIPYLGMYLTDITFILEGNKKIQDGKANGSIPKLIGKSVQDLGNMQKKLLGKTHPTYNLDGISKISSKYDPKIANNTSLAFHPRKKAI